MRKWNSALFLTFIFQNVLAQSAAEDKESSGTGAVFIGIIVLVVIVVILYNRQKRKFND